MKRALALMVVLSSVALAGADGQQPPASAAIFVCGNDQTLPNPIPLREATIILAGDGRLYRPCPEAATHTPDHRELREQALIRTAYASATPLQRWRAAQAIARLSDYVRAVTAATSRSGNAAQAISTRIDDPLGELVQAPVARPACSSRTPVVGTLLEPRRWQPGVLFDMLDDRLLEVQREGAYAIGKRASFPGRRAEFYDALYKELTFCVLRQQVGPARAPAGVDEITGLLLEAIGLTAFPNASQRDTAEEFLVQQARGSEQRVLGAARGIEALIRGNPRRPIQNATRARLRDLSVYGLAAGQPVKREPPAIIRMLAVQSLFTAGETDLAFVRQVAADDDWQVRRLVASRLDPSSADHADVVAIFRRDPAFQVRYDLVGAFGRAASRTAKCAPLAEFLADPAPVVVMRALDSLPAKCDDLESGLVLPQLTTMADRLEVATAGQDPMSWHIPARALTALSRLRPDQAPSRLTAAARNAIWQVRATAAAVAGTLQKFTILETLAADAHANVQTAALDALSRAKQPSVVPLALRVLGDAADNQLLMTAARVLRGLPAESKDDATAALLGALRRLRDGGSDMSRDPRVAILERLGETMHPSRSSDLQTYLSDFDDSVVEAAERAFTAVVGSAPAAVAKRRRYPAQLPEAELSRPQLTAKITTDDGVIDLALLPDVAPVTVALFRFMALGGLYNGKSIHRIAPNFVVQGGSPGANEYSGVWQRFLRDEVGPQARHIRGAVGISTRGPDTGDGQIFIDLVDSPRLDRAYTVFAYVTSGMEVVDRMLEGAVIRSVTVK